MAASATEAGDLKSPTPAQQTEEQVTKKTCVELVSRTTQLSSQSQRCNPKTAILTVILSATIPYFTI